MSICSEDEVLAYLESCGIPLSNSAVVAVEMLQPMYDKAIEKALGWKVNQQSFTEYHPETPMSGPFDRDDQISGYEMAGGLAQPRLRGARELRYLQLRNLPVRSITSVYDNGSAFLTGVEDGYWPSTTLLDRTAYQLDKHQAGLSWTGLLARNYGVWGTIPRTVKVTYVAGLTDAEIMDDYSPIKLASLITIANGVQQTIARSRAAQVGGVVTSVGGEEFNVSLQTTLGTNVAEVIIPAAAANYLSDFVNVSRWFGR